MVVVSGLSGVAQHFSTSSGDPLSNTRQTVHRTRSSTMFLGGAFSICVLLQMAPMASPVANGSTGGGPAPAAFVPTYNMYVSVFQRLEAPQLGVCSQVTRVHLAAYIGADQKGRWIGSGVRCHVTLLYGNAVYQVGMKSTVVSRSISPSSCGSSMQESTPRHNWFWLGSTRTAKLSVHFNRCLVHCTTAYVL